MTTSTPAARTSRVNVAAQVTAHIVELLQNGVRPWEQPWSTNAALGLPIRANGVAYRGCNVLILWAAAHHHHYASRRWLSFKQARAMGGFVRRGETATRIVFYSDGAARGDAEEAAPGTTDGAPQRRRAVLRSYAVFNADQVDGLPEDFSAAPPSRSRTTDEADRARLAAHFATAPATIEHGGTRAYYAPERDVIRLPPPETFTSTQTYYATLLHELGHWTAHASRLDRDLKSQGATDAYFRDELVAELTAAFLGAELDLSPDHLESHASYIDHYLRLLDREPGALLVATGRAQAAADFLRPHLGLGSAPAAEHATRKLAQ